MNKEKTSLTDIALVLVSGGLLLTVLLGIAGRRGMVAQTESQPHLVIDAGHGGEDGGASAADGTLEKDINLAIALPLGDMLHIMGFDVLQTRTEDAMIFTEGNTLRERKVSDIKNRLSLIEQADMAVSIHQNKFPQSQYYGAQMFYAPANANSKVLAEAVRSSVLSLLQPDNTRELKKGEDTVYLLKHATKPLVLVECGFLSNEQECAKLKTSDYQRQMAFAIAGGMFSYFS